MAAARLTTEQILGLLQQTPQRIAAITASLPSGQLRLAPAPGEWSAVEVLAHLRSCADVWGSCVATILAEERPTIRAVNPTTWIRSTDYPVLDFEVSRSAYDGQRGALLRVLQQLPEQAWARCAIVTGAGPVLERTVASYAQWLGTHERTHVRQFARIARTLPGMRAPGTSPSTPGLPRQSSPPAR